MTIALRVASRVISNEEPADIIHLSDSICEIENSLPSYLPSIDDSDLVNPSYTVIDSHENDGESDSNGN